MVLCHFLSTKKVGKTVRFPVMMKNFSCVAIRFFFGTRSAKTKLCKKTRVEEISPSADGDKGSAPLTAPTFEKVGSKLLSGGHKNPFKKF